MLLPLCVEKRRITTAGYYQVWSQDVHHNGEPCPQLVSVRACSKGTLVVEEVLVRLSGDPAAIMRQYRRFQKVHVELECERRRRTRLAIDFSTVVHASRMRLKC